MYFPFMVDVQNKNIVVIGGGKVAVRKCTLMLNFGAKVSVVSPELCPEFSEILGNIEWHRDTYRPEYLSGAMAVIAATDNDRINQSVYRDCTRQSIPINVVDSPEECSFIVPSVIQKGHLTLAISTGGKCPAMAKHIRKELERSFDDRFEEKLNLLAQLREILMGYKITQKERAEILNSACSMTPEDILLEIAKYSAS